MSGSHTQHRMQLEPVQPSRLAFAAGYVLSYCISTALLYSILVLWRQLPGWGLLHIVIITASVAIVARLVAWWLS